MDVFLTIVSGGVQLVAAILGVHLSLKPPEGADAGAQKRRYIVAFLLLGVVGLGITVVQQYRNSAEQADLKQELADLKASASATAESIKNVEKQTMYPPSVKIDLPAPVVKLIPAPLAPAPRSDADVLLERLQFGGNTYTTISGVGWHDVHDATDVTLNWDEMAQTIAQAEINYGVTEGIRAEQSQIIIRILNVTDKTVVARSDVIDQKKVQESKQLQTLKMQIPRSKGMKSYRLQFSGDGVRIKGEVVLYRLSSN